MRRTRLLPFAFLAACSSSVDLPAPVPHVSTDPEIVHDCTVGWKPAAVPYVYDGGPGPQPDPSCGGQGEQGGDAGDQWTIWCCIPDGG